MSSSHSKSHEPNAMSNGFVRLTLILTFALLAALLWGTCGKSLGGDAGGHGHGKGHGDNKEHGTKAAAITHEDHTTVSSPPGKVDTATGDFIYELGKMITIDLPNGAGKLASG